MSSIRFRSGLLLVALSAAPLFADPVPAGPTDEQLKQSALKLNDAATLDTAIEAANKLLRPRADAKRLAKVAAKLQKDADKPPLKFNAALALAKLAQVVREYDAAEALYESCAAAAREISSKSKLLEVQVELLELHLERKRYADAEAAGTLALDLIREQAKEGKEPSGLRLLVLYEQVLQAKGLQGKADEALAEADALAKDLFPKIGAYFLQVKALIQAESGKPDAAVATLGQFIAGFDDLPEPLRELFPNMKDVARYRLSGYQVDAGDIDGAIKTLKGLLADLTPEHRLFVTLHNDLGFVLADHGKELAEAEKLCRKALKLEADARQKLLADGKVEAADANKENAAYLDSLGWVLFKQEKYKEALPLLEKAAADEDDGRHLEIWDHLADCLVQLGQKDKAVTTWEKALTFEDVSKKDVERRKKVSAKLKAAKAAK